MDLDRSLNRRLAAVVASCVVAVVASAACGSSDEDVAKGRPGSGGSGGASADGSAASGGTSSGGTGAVVNTDTGTPCLGGCDGGECINGVCCPSDLACGDACCAATDVCSFQKCVTPGNECIDSSECAPTEYCELSLGGDPMPGDAGACLGGVVLDTGQCLEKPPVCPAGMPPTPGEPLTCLPECQYVPLAGAFVPELKAHWNKASIMMSPIVIQLDDDNCDNVVDERDIPEILFVSFPNTDPSPSDATYNYGHATLWAISLINGQFVEKWSFTPTTDALKGSTELAAGNFDGLPGNEVVVCTANGKVRAVSATGQPLWTNSDVGCRMPAIGDLGGDGKVEIVVAGAVIDGATGATVTTTPGGRKSLADLDGDGNLDLVSPTAVYRADGTVMADTGLSGAYLAIGDFDVDGTPEVVSVDKPNHIVNIWHYDASQPGNFEVVRSGVDINGTFPNTCPSGSSGSTTGGGPPTVADFNGDGTPDVAIAGGIGYAVIDGTKVLDPTVSPDQTLLWLQQTHDCSSAATGSSVFDFNGDGQAEVVYSDEHFLRIYNGVDGAELFKTCNTTGTLLEYPLVADVDADGHADLVVIANDYSSITCPDGGTKQRGLRVFGDTQGKWVRTRRVWNQHNYHVTNVEEDGTIPANEARNWMQPRLNNYRQNVQPLGEFNAPDLIVSLSTRCSPSPELVALVRNIGSASVPAGVVVGFYAGDPLAGGMLLGQETTTKALAPAEAVEVTLAVGSFPTTSAFAVVDDGMPSHAWQECRTDNNVSEGITAECPGPK